MRVGQPPRDVAVTMRASVPLPMFEIVWANVAVVDGSVMTLPCGTMSTPASWPTVSTIVSAVVYGRPFEPMKFRVVMLRICVPAGVCARSGSGDPRVANTAPKRAHDTQPAVRLVWGRRPNRMMRIQESIMARRRGLLDLRLDPD